MSIDTQYRIMSVGWLVDPSIRHNVMMTFPNMEICMKMQLFMMIKMIMLIMMILLIMKILLIMMILLIRLI